MLFPYCNFYSFYYYYPSHIPIILYNPNNNFFPRINFKRIDWEVLINKWIYIQNSNNKWIFGKISDYNSTTHNFKILALVNGKHQYIKQDTEEIIEAWLIEKWTQIIPSNTILNVSGKWDTNYGEMILKQSGTKVTGTYTHDNGKIEGILKDNVMTGTWSEAPTYNPTHDAGKFEFIFTNNSFKGKWGYGDKKPNSVWTGTRIRSYT